MNKEKYYNKIKAYVYRQFDKLKIKKSKFHNSTIYLYYEKNIQYQIRIEKYTGEVRYDYNLEDNINKIIPIARIDFQILLAKWINDKFQIKVSSISGRNLIH